VGSAGIPGVSRFSGLGVAGMRGYSREFPAISCGMSAGYEVV
jgi:hypothetical protein